MIQIVDRRELTLWHALLKALVEQERARGDNLEHASLVQDLLQGAQTLVVVREGAGKDGPVLMIMLIQEVKDRVRPVKILYINNFYLPSKDAFLAADLSQEKKEFARLAQSYDKVLFQTRNAALVRFLSGIGLTPQMEGMVYSLRAGDLEGGA